MPAQPRRLRPAPPPPPATRHRREHLPHFTCLANGSNGSNGSVSIGGWVAFDVEALPPRFWQRCAPPPSPPQEGACREIGRIYSHKRTAARAGACARSSAQPHRVTRGRQRVRAYTGGTTNVDHVG